MHFTTKFLTAAGAALVLASAPAPRAQALSLPAVTAPAVRVVASTTITAIMTTQDAKVDISVNDHKAGAWYTSPVWIAIGIIALVLIIALIAMAGRGRDTTVIK